MRMFPLTQLMPKSSDTSDPVRRMNPAQSICRSSYKLSPYFVDFNFAKKARMRREEMQKGRLSQKIQRHCVCSESDSPMAGPVRAPKAQLDRKCQSVNGGGVERCRTLTRRRGWRTIAACRRERLDP